MEGTGCGFHSNYNVSWISLHHFRNTLFCQEVGLNLVCYNISLGSPLHTQPVLFAIHVQPIVCLPHRLIWILIVLGVSMGFVFVIYDRVNKYFDHEKNVNVEIEYGRGISFPAVTVCNQNFLRLVLFVYIVCTF